MPHLLVDQLAFARTELVRSLAGVTAEEAVQRFVPMNCLSWIVGHLANQEQQVFLVRQGLAPVAPELDALVGFGKPASTPPLTEMWAAWKTVTAATAPVLAAMTDHDLLSEPLPGRTPGESNGTLLLRVTAHYWFHIGEGQAIRQLLGHTDLPTFVGGMGKESQFRID
jgi:hypothetical protein